MTIFDPEIHTTLDLTQANFGLLQKLLACKAIIAKRKYAFIFLHVNPLLFSYLPSNYHTNTTTNRAGAEAAISLRVASNTYPCERQWWQSTTCPISFSSRTDVRRDPNSSGDSIDIPRVNDRQLVLFSYFEKHACVDDSLLIIIACIISMNSCVLSKHLPGVKFHVQK